MEMNAYSITLILNYYVYTIYVSMNAYIFLFSRRSYIFPHIIFTYYVYIFNILIL